MSGLGKGHGKQGEANHNLGVQVLCLISWHTTSWEVVFIFSKKTTDVSLSIWLTCVTKALTLVTFAVSPETLMSQDKAFHLAHWHDRMVCRQWLALPSPWHVPASHCPGNPCTQCQSFRPPIKLSIPSPVTWQPDSCPIKPLKGCHNTAYQHHYQRHNSPTPWQMKFKSTNIPLL